MPTAREVWMAVMAAALCAALAAPARASDPAPTVPGQCIATTITTLSHRFDDDPSSGSFVEYATGTIGVEYDEIPEVGRAKVGDKVELCLVSLPEDCPAGDERGSALAYYPEANVLTGTAVAPRSKTPAFKSVPV